MERAVIDIPRVGASHSAAEIYKVFTNLGWTHEMTEYLPQGANGRFTSKIRTLCFQWRKPEKPIYPDSITYKTLV